MKWLSKYSEEIRPLLISFLCDSDCRYFVQMSAHVSRQEYAVQFFRGKCFYYGWGVGKDLQSAFSIIEDVMRWACDNYQSDADAQWILGEIYDLKLYGGTPIVAPRELFEMAYRNGNVFGAYNLARKLRLFGRSLDESLLCLECERFCADAGFPNALDKLRQAYCGLLTRRDDLPEIQRSSIFEDFQKHFNDRGASLLVLGQSYKSKYQRGGDKDVLKKTYEIFVQSLKSGEKRAAVELCELYLRESELTTAEEWAARASQLGEKGAIISIATYNAVRMAKCCEDVGKTDMVRNLLAKLIEFLPDDAMRKSACIEIGRVFEEHWRVAIRNKPQENCNVLQFVKSWYVRAIEFGNVCGYSAIGDLYLSVMHYKEAEEWYDKAIVNGDKPQVGRLGIKYELQERFEDAARCYKKASKINGPDELLKIARMFNSQGMNERAAEWYVKAAEAGSVVALWAIGNLYLHGKIFPQKKDLALNYFLKAANKGLVQAMKSVADFYGKERLAIGVEPDYNAAFMWYRKSSDGGYGLAWYELGQMHKKGVGCPKDAKEALECFKKAGKDKVRLAFYEIGQYYELGSCVDPNEYEALRCYWYGWGLKSGKCEEALKKLIGHDRRLDYFVQRMARGEERSEPSFLRDVQAIPEDRESASRMELPYNVETRDRDGCYYVEGIPIPDANSQEEADIIYGNTH